VPSHAHTRWEGDRVTRLDELEDVHRQLTGTAPGRRWITDQLDRGYVVALASQFQGYCRDLHSEMAGAIASEAPESIRGLVESSFALGRYLDRGNATAGNIGADFGRFGLEFWDTVYDLHASNRRRRELLDQVMVWRNSIAHDSPIAPSNAHLVEGTAPTLTWGRRWRRGLNALVPYFDRVAADHVEDLTGHRPW